MYSSSKTDGKMRDFLIPTFEQYQFLRELRKTARRKQTATPSSLLAKDEHDHEHTNLLPQSKIPPQSLLSHETSETNGDDDDSATEIGSPSSIKNVTNDDRRSLLSQDVIWNPQKPLANQQSSNSPIPIMSKNDVNGLPPIIGVDLVTSPTKMLDAKPNQQPNISHHDNTLRVDHNHTSKQVTSSTPKSPLSVGGAILPLLESSPEPCEEEFQRHRPWFQRKRKRKLQQTRLLFTK